MTTKRLGRTGGGPPKLTDDDIEAAKALLANSDIGVTQIAHRLGVSLSLYIPAARTANTPAFDQNRCKFAKNPNPRKGYPCNSRGRPLGLLA